MRLEESFEPHVARERAGWKAVSVPAEHGGWGLTLEPVLLGLVVAWSGAGMALGLVAFAAFLVRTPLKVVAVDLRRGRWLDRSRLALRIAIAELIVLGACVAIAIVRAGWSWLAPVAIAAPLIVVEVSFDIRSRSRRLVPELCGAAGITAVAASIVLASGRDAALAAGVWLVLAARALGSITFVRVQIQRLRRGHASVWPSDLAQVAAVAVAATAVLADQRLMLGAVGVVLLAAAQTVWVRLAPIPAKRLGLRQMALGMALVTVSAVGVLW